MTVNSRTFIGLTKKQSVVNFIDIYNIYSGLIIHCIFLFTVEISNLFRTRTESYRIIFRIHTEPIPSRIRIRIETEFDSHSIYLEFCLNSGWVRNRVRFGFGSYGNSIRLDSNYIFNGNQN